MRIARRGRAGRRRRRPATGCRCTGSGSATGSPRRQLAALRHYTARAPRDRQRPARSPGRRSPRWAELRPPTQPVPAATLGPAPTAAGRPTADRAAPAARTSTAPAGCPGGSRCAGRGSRRRDPAVERAAELAQSGPHQQHARGVERSAAGRADRREPSPGRPRGPPTARRRPPARRGRQSAPSTDRSARGGQADRLVVHLAGGPTCSSRPEPSGPPGRPAPAPPRRRGWRRATAAPLSRCRASTSSSGRPPGRGCRGARSARRTGTAAARRASARARPTRCCSPPDSSAGRRPARCAMPQLAEQVRGASRAGLRRARPRRERVGDGVQRGQVRPQRVVLEHHAEVTPLGWHGCAAGAGRPCRPPSQISPLDGVHEEPATDVAAGSTCPEPDGPSSATTSPAPDPQRHVASARRPRRTARRGPDTAAHPRAAAAVRSGPVTAHRRPPAWQRQRPLRPGRAAAPAIARQRAAPAGRRPASAP